MTSKSTFSSKETPLVILEAGRKVESSTSGRDSLNPECWRYKLQGSGHWMYASNANVARMFGAGSEEPLITVATAKRLLSKKGADVRKGVMRFREVVKK